MTGSPWKDRQRMRCLTVMLCVLTLAFLAAPAALVLAEIKMKFPGPVLTVDWTTGKLAVKQGGGTRFTLAADDKAQFEGVQETSKT